MQRRGPPRPGAARPAPPGASPSPSRLPAAYAQPPEFPVTVRARLVLRDGWAAERRRLAGDVRPRRCRCPCPASWSRCPYAAQVGPAERAGRGAAAGGWCGARSLGRRCRAGRSLLLLLLLLPSGGWRATGAAGGSPAPPPRHAGRTLPLRSCGVCPVPRPVELGGEASSRSPLQGAAAGMRRYPGLGLRWVRRRVCSGLGLRRAPWVLLWGGVAVFIVLASAVPDISEP